MQSRTSPLGPSRPSHPSHNLHPQPLSPQSRQTLKHLYYIFTYYCSFGDRQNYEYLKIQNFKRLLTDAQLIPQFPQNVQEKGKTNGEINRIGLQVDLLYTKVKGNQVGVNFQGFLELIKDVGRVLYGEGKEEEGVRVLVHGNLQALFQFIRDNTQFGQCIQFLTKTTYQQSCFILLRSLSPTLLRIYLHHFDTRNHSPTNTPSSLFKLLTNFTKSFEITPQLLSKTQSFIIFTYIVDKLENGLQFPNYTINQENQNIYQQWFNDDRNNPFYFRYFHFVLFFIIASLVSRRKIEGVGATTQVGGLGVFLEVLGVSKGFAKFCKIQHINMHLIPNQKLLKQLQQKSSSTIHLKSSKTSPTKSRLTTTNNLHTHHQHSTSSPQIHPILLKNYAELHKKFVSFCIQGQTIGSNYLSNKKVINIFQSLGLQLGQAEIQICLAYVMGNLREDGEKRDKREKREKGEKKEKRERGIDFQAFLRVLQKIAEKVNVQVEDVTKKILFLGEQSQTDFNMADTKKNIIMTRTQYRNCQAMLQLLQPLLSNTFHLQCQPYPSTNSNSNPKQTQSFLSLPSYLKIMHNYQLSPTYIKKESLVQIFRKSIKKSLDFMNFQEFKDSFIIAVRYLDVGVGEREQMPETMMVVMFQRINQSRGVKRMMGKGKEDYLGKFRTVFKKYYPDEVVNKNQPTTRHILQMLQSNNQH